MMSIVPLLIADPSVPAAARSALRLARTTRDHAAAMSARRAAARVLVDELGLTCAEATELVELPDELRAATCAA